MARADRNSNQPIRVTISTSNGTATTGDSDYTALPANTYLTFNPGASKSQTFTVQTTQETKVESTEYFNAKRSGKGTLARVLRQLIGAGNVCGPTTSSLAEQFGLQPLVGKTLAIVSDARFHGDKIATVAERLLCISGEDPISIPRKHLTNVEMKLPTRFMFLTNELACFTDASNALVGRFLILRLTQSFYGKEDVALTGKLLGELPGILNWAIEGWHRLNDRGYFVLPQSSREIVQEMEDLSSPVSAFVRESCELGPSLRATIDCLFIAWKDWCEGQRHRVR